MEPQSKHRQYWINWEEGQEENIKEQDRVYKIKPLQLVRLEQRMSYQDESIEVM